MAVHAFAFQTGDWLVRHRKLRHRLLGSTDWYEFSGTCAAWELLEGAGNVDDHWIDDPAGPYSAATIRRLEPDGQWAIWWQDSRREGLDSPLKGSFEDGRALFFGIDEFEGRPIEVRFIWSELTKNPRWEQAFSVDNGATWETNWIMDFQKIG
jgi:hypothetical protein